ncbi:hypothetical protein Mgra_00010168 [Meloidogyne graminicola]|uniref:Transmembrane protein n=1 Tax=Meloidogyne graminicola TaxID=189291 RepID=A0A8S9Z7I7_9BILA|nr:hypothetical protein Mgra_00010168 [Meloidogyne graminicola]
MANYLNILTFLISFISLILLINASPQAYNSFATNNPARTAFMSLSPDVKKNFILMLLTSFNKTSSDIDASCQQVLNGQSSANIICQGLKDMESKQQAAFVDFTNSLQDPTLKAAATQFNQNVLQNNGMTMGEKCKQFFDYANSLNATNKMTLFKDMFKGHFDGYQGNGMSTFGNPQNNMVGSSGNWKYV